MKNSIMLIFVLLLCGLVEAADYDGSSKYPATSLVSGQFTLVVSGVVQTKTFSQLHTAMSAAVITSQQCSCEVVIRSPDIRINTKWKAVPTTPTVPVTFDWARPDARENGKLLRTDEIGGYELVRRSGGKSTDTTMIKGEGLDVIQYTAYMPYLVNDKFVISAFDTNGLYSDFVEIEPKVGNM